MGRRPRVDRGRNKEEKRPILAGSPYEKEPTKDYMDYINRCYWEPRHRRLGAKKIKMGFHLMVDCYWVAHTL